MVSGIAVDPELKLHSDQSQFTVRDYVSSRSTSNIYWNIENAHAVHDVPYYEIKVVCL
jgi:hypothetical protein